MTLIDILAQIERETGIDVVDMAVVTEPRAQRVLREIIEGTTKLFVVTLLLHCERCSHNWRPKGQNPPKYCPNCNSPYWNKPRR